MKRLLSFLCLVLLLGCTGTPPPEQEPELKNDLIVPNGTHGLGWIKDVNTQQAPDFASIRQTLTKDLPSTLDLRSEMSPVEDQGYINSCVANSIVGGLEFLQIKNGIPKGKRFLDMSRMWLYYVARDMDGLARKDIGCYINSAVSATTKVGMVTEARWPYTRSRLFKKPTKQLYNVAQKKLVKDAYYISTNTVDNIKAALADGYPVIFGTAVYSSFFQGATTGFIPIPDLAKDTYCGGHAMVIVGYTPTHFIVRNSWGPAWGDRGYCYIPFGYLSIYGSYNPTFDFWVIRLQTNLFTKDPDPPTR